MGVEKMSESKVTDAEIEAMAEKEEGSFYDMKMVGRK